MNEKKSIIHTVFKICIFGNASVGKTSLMQRYLTGNFSDNKLTVGLDIGAKDLTIGNVNVALQIWDFAGKERFRFLLPNYSKGASAAIFMYDLSRVETLKNINEWFEVFNPYPDDPNRKIPLLLVGGKSDVSKREKIVKKEIKRTIKKFNFHSYHETSSLSGQNVDLIFEVLIDLILKNAGIKTK